MREKVFSAIFFSAAIVWAIATLVVIALSGNLRLSKEALYTIVTASIVGILIIALIAVMISGWIADSISEELNKIDWDKPDESNVKSEFLPLIERISKKNEQIASQMNELKCEHESRDRMRREFTANVSHELKTPLTSISGFAEIIRDGLVKREEDVNRFAGNIYDEAQRLITLVGDIIKLSQLDEEALPVKWEDVDLYEICSAVLEQLRPVAETRGIELELWGESTVIYGVWQIIDEIIFNLCDNAVKYNRDSGFVKVTIDRFDDRVEVAVRDNGIGISPEEHERVFERFYRVNKSHSKDIGGTGLGLSIVKHGVAFLNAEYHIESNLGDGTRIKVVFKNKLRNDS